MWFWSSRIRNCLFRFRIRQEWKSISIQIVFLILGPSILDCTGTMVKYHYRVRVRKLSCMHDFVSVGHWLTLYFWHFNRILAKKKMFAKQFLPVYIWPRSNKSFRPKIMVENLITQEGCRTYVQILILHRNLWDSKTENAKHGCTFAANLRTNRCRKLVLNKSVKSNLPQSQFALSL